MNPYLHWHDADIVVSIVQNARMDSCNFPARVIPANVYRRERWCNGLGWTREILRLPMSSEEWVLRLSIAEIEHDGAFSVFPGIDRELILLHGEGIRLCFEDGVQHVLQQPCARLCFAGERPLRSELLAAPPARCFNVMWRRDLVRTQVLHRPLVGSMLFFAEPGIAWAVYLLAGQAHFDEASGLPSLAAGDSAWLAADVRQRFALSGGGEVLAIRVESLIVSAD